MADGFDPRLTPARPEVAAESLRGRVEAERYAEPRMMVATTPTAPLTSRPHGEAPMTSELLFGERFTVYDTSQIGWAWGQAERDGYVGWAPAACFSQESEPATHRVRTRHALVWSEPDLKTRPVGALPFDARVRAGESDSKGWRPLAEGGFMPSAHLDPADEPEADWVAAAERFEGAPYLWGGRTPVGVDCSGLVQTARQAAGHACLRDSDMQEAAPGADVAPGALRRGDLVFWRGHVGIMLSETVLLHANARHMACAQEPLSAAVARIEASGGGAPTAIRRWDV